MPTADLCRHNCKEAIRLTRLLVVEGYEACRVLVALLRHLDLLDVTEVRNPGSNTEFKDYFDVLTMTSGFEYVTNIGLIRDAETDVNAAFRSICGILERHSLPVPETSNSLATQPDKPNVSVFILPDCQNTGAIETLLLKAIQENPVMPCLETYLDCIKRVQPEIAWNENNEHKAILQAYRASLPRPGLKLGEAAQREGSFPWDSPAFDDLRRFLMTILGERG